MDFMDLISWSGGLFHGYHLLIRRDISWISSPDQEGYFMDIISWSGWISWISSPDQDGFHGSNLLIRMNFMDLISRSEWITWILSPDQDKISSPDQNGFHWSHLLIRMDFMDLISWSGWISWISSPDQNGFHYSYLLIMRYTSLLNNLKTTYSDHKKREYDPKKIEMIHIRLHTSYLFLSFYRQTSYVLPLYVKLIINIYASPRFAPPQLPLPFGPLLFTLLWIKENLIQFSFRFHHNLF